MSRATARFYAELASGNPFGEEEQNFMDAWQHTAHHNDTMKNDSPHSKDGLKASFSAISPYGQALESHDLPVRQNQQYSSLKHWLPGHNPQPNKSTMAVPVAGNIFASTATRPDTRTIRNQFEGAYEYVSEPRGSYSSCRRSQSEAWSKKPCGLDEGEEVCGQKVTRNRNTRSSSSSSSKLFNERGFFGVSKDENDTFETERPAGKAKLGIMAIVANKITEMAEKADISPTKLSFSRKQPTVTEFRITVKPEQQARIYAELELLICSTANDFLMTECRQNRMEPQSVRKIVDSWNSKGRAQVIEFRFDQATQRDLIVANVTQMRFLGPQAADTLRVNAILWMWKENARDMSVRTFCCADAVVRKQLYDTYRIMELLGASAASHAKLQELYRTFMFWLMDVEKQRHGEAVPEYGVERVWKPKSIDGNTA